MQLLLLACFTAASAAAVGSPLMHLSYKLPGLICTEEVICPSADLYKTPGATFITMGEMKIKDRYKIVRNYKRRLKIKCRLLTAAIVYNKRNEYTKDLTTDELVQTKAGMIEILDGISAMEKSEVIFKVIYGGTPDTNHGITMVDTSNGAILIRYPYNSDGKALIGHEIWHGIQYDRGEISFKRSDCHGGVLCDITDEREAYRKMWLSHIDVRSARSIDDDSTRRISTNYLNFPAGPVNLDSTAGIALRVRTVEEGRQGRSNSEFYKGWKKDYKKGQDSVRGPGLQPTSLHLSSPSYSLFFHS